MRVGVRVGVRGARTRPRGSLCNHCVEFSFVELVEMGLEGSRGYRCRIIFGEP